jgi:DNA-binding NtrC family response regulator
MQEDRRKRVLIIEDEASIGLMVAEILADEGFGVIGPVGNRREALSALQARGLLFSSPSLFRFRSRSASFATPSACAR